MATAVPGASTPDIDGLWDGLWKAAVDQYRRSLGVDLGDQGDTVVNELQCCSTAEEILDVLQARALYVSITSVFCPSFIERDDNGGNRRPGVDARGRMCDVSA